MTGAWSGVGGLKAAVAALGLLYVLTALAILATAQPSGNLRAAAPVPGEPAASQQNPSGAVPSP